MKNLKQVMSAMLKQPMVKYAFAIMMMVVFTTNAKAQMNGDTAPNAGDEVTYYADYAFTHELDTPCYDVYWYSYDGAYTIIDQGFDMQYGDYITIKWTTPGNYTLHGDTYYVNTSDVPDGNPDNIRTTWDYESMAVSVQ